MSFLWYFKCHRSTTGSIYNQFTTLNTESSKENLNGATIQKSHVSYFWARKSIPSGITDPLHFNQCCYLKHRGKPSIILLVAFALGDSFLSLLSSWQLLQKAPISGSLCSSPLDPTHSNEPIILMVIFPPGVKSSACVGKINQDSLSRREFHS